MDLIDKIIQQIISPLMVIVFSLAVIYFLWTVLKFIREADVPDKRQENAMGIVWGVAGLAIMFSVYSIIDFILNSIGL